MKRQGHPLPLCKALVAKGCVFRGRLSVGFCWVIVVFVLDCVRAWRVRDVCACGCSQLCQCCLWLLSALMPWCSAHPSGVAWRRPCRAGEPPLRPSAPPAFRLLAPLLGLLGFSCVPLCRAASGHPYRKPLSFLPSGYAVGLRTARHGGTENSPRSPSDASESRIRLRGRAGRSSARHCATLHATSESIIRALAFARSASITLHAGQIKPPLAFLGSSGASAVAQWGITRKTPL